MWESTYISRRLDIRPGDVADVAARWHRGLRRSQPSSRLVRVSPGFWLSPDAADSADAYEVRGLMWTWGRPVRVTLEFAGWSRTQSEVGVGPRSPGWPVGSAQYVRRVTTALEGLSRALCPSTGRVDASSGRATESAERRGRMRPHLTVPART